MVIKLGRRRLRDALVQNEDGEQDFFEFQAACIRKFGLAAGVFIRQLVFWDGKGADPEGWIYKTRDELEEEIGLSQRQQDKARKTLTGLGILEEERRTVAPHHLYCAMHYRVDLEKLLEVLETPHSTLNQWKRGRRYTKDSEGVGFTRSPEKEGSTSQEVSLDIIESDVPLGNTESDVPLGNSESEVSLDITESDVSLGNSVSDVRLGTTESTSENTPGEYLRGTSENSSENSFREFSFQEAAGAKNRAAPPTQVNKNKEVSKDQGPVTTSSTHRPNVDPRMASEVRRLMESGRHTPVALKHYRHGRVGDRDVAQCVSQDATGSLDKTEFFLPVVRSVLEEARVAS